MTVAVHSGSRNAVEVSECAARPCFDPPQVHDYLEELGDADRIVDTISVDQTANSTYSINQVIAGGFDARANLQVRGGPLMDRWGL